MLRNAILILLLSGCTNAATGSGPGIPLGVPAAPNVQKAYQPDGYAFKLRLRGDEWNNWHETLEGYAIIFQKENRTWYYAKCNKGKLVSGSIPVGNKVPLDWPKASQLTAGKCN